MNMEEEEGKSGFDSSTFPDFPPYLKIRIMPMTMTSCRACWRVAWFDLPVARVGNRAKMEVCPKKLQRKRRRIGVGPSVRRGPSVRPCALLRFAPYPICVYYLRNAVHHHHWWRARIGATTGINFLSDLRQRLFSESYRGSRGKVLEFSEVSLTTWKSAWILRSKSDHVEKCLNSQK